MERSLPYMIFLFTFILFAKSDYPEVTTGVGLIVGKTTEKPLEEMQLLQKGDKIYREVHEYLGIPFAQPPTGERRFRKPEMLTKLTSPFYARSYGAVCPQTATLLNTPSLNMSEDCLFLNIYIPARPADDASGHAVMVWIHGGGFLEGAGQLYDGGNMAVAGNIIVVTINYRLGVFGFLGIGDKRAPGNIGIWDQHLAFQWVNKYIGAFGGDNKRITIAGESAGAMSVTQHALFTGNNGLFNRVIAQSGSMSIPMRDIEKSLFNDTVLLGKTLNCQTDSMDNLLYCLRDLKSGDEIFAAYRQLSFRLNLGPTLDEDLIKINPQKIAKMSESLPEVEFFRSLDILSGINAYEGAFFWANVFSRAPIEAIQPTLHEMRTELLPFLLNRIFRIGYNPDFIKLVESQYTNWAAHRNDSNSIRLQITKLLGDANFGAPAVEMANLHKMSSGSGNFMYHFKPKTSVVTTNTPSWIPGANHMDELPFMFGMTHLLGKGDENAWERELSYNMVTYWTNFIKTGNPNSPEPITPSWPEYSANTGDFLKLEKYMSNTSAGQYFYAEEANFWLNVFKDLVGAEKKCTIPIDINTSTMVVPVYQILSSALIIVLTLIHLC